MVKVIMRIDDDKSAVWLICFYNIHVGRTAIGINNVYCVLLHQCIDIGFVGNQFTKFISIQRIRYLQFFHMVPPFFFIGTVTCAIRNDVLSHLLIVGEVVVFCLFLIKLSIKKLKYRLCIHDTAGSLVTCSVLHEANESASNHAA